MTRAPAPEFRPIGEVRPQERVAVRGVIRSVTAMALKGCPACRYVLADGTGELDLMFLGRIEIPGLEPGRHCSAEGMTAMRDDRIVLWNPRYQLEAAATNEVVTGGGKVMALEPGAPAWSPAARSA
jgi:hypothetical protein